jgi:hypothetical protein
MIAGLIILRDVTREEGLSAWKETHRERIVGAGRVGVVVCRAEVYEREGAGCELSDMCNISTQTGVELSDWCKEI